MPIYVANELSIPPEQRLEVRGGHAADSDGRHGLLLRERRRYVAEVVTCSG